MRRQQRKFGSGCGADTLDLGLPSQVGIDVEHDRRQLTGPHVGKLRLLEIGLNPRRRIADQCKERRRSAHVLTRQQLHVDSQPAERRGHDGPVEIELRSIARGDLFPEQRMRFDRDFWIAAKLREDALHLLSRRHDTGTGSIGVRVGLLELEGLAHALVRKPLLALALGVVELHAILGLFLICDGLVILGAQCLDAGACLIGFRLRLVQSHLVRLGINLHEHVARLDLAVVLHADLDHTTRYLRYHVDDISLHVGIFGTHVAAAPEVPEHGASNRDGRYGDQQDGSQ